MGLEEMNAQTMYLTAENSTEYISYPLLSLFAVKTEWTDEHDASIVRVPEEQTNRFAVDGPLTVMGKPYPSLFSSESPFSGLTHGQQTIDRYGRSIICFMDRFPCFDSDDFFNENRYFHWFFVREGNVLTRLFFQDETKEVIVTEDVAYIERSCWDYMKEAGFCQRKDC